MPDVPVADSIEVEPLTSMDWEVLEANAGYLEEQILNQVRRRRESCGQGVSHAPIAIRK